MALSSEREGGEGRLMGGDAEGKERTLAWFLLRELVVAFAALGIMDEE